VRRAVREHLKEFLLVLALVALGLATTAVILSRQQQPYPAWLPFLGDETFEIQIELETAQAIIPGQGQTVNVAGIRVGDVTDVELEDGHAVVTAQVDDRYRDLIRADASALLRPRTGLQDMTVEVDPGVASKAIAEDGVIPLSSSRPNVNPDQVLGSLDRDTQDYLTLLIQGGARGIGGRGEELSATLRRFSPLARYLAKINGGLAERRASIERAITSFKEVSEALGGADTRLSEFVDSSEAVLSSFARQEASLRETFRELPGALSATRDALERGDAFAQSLGTATEALLPSAVALKPALESAQPFFRETTAPIRDQIVPFTRQTQPTFVELRKTGGKLSKAAPVLRGAVAELNRLLNAVAFNPAGPEESNLFWASWLGHNTNALFTLQDADGPVRRVIAMQSCETAIQAEGVAVSIPFLQTLIDATRIPDSADIC
jgi:phospholipid/cholesterol/gamma-HCH transport system substrate-binding protein